jgi:hypothetical protein
MKKLMRTAIVAVLLVGPASYTTALAQGKGGAGQGTGKGGPRQKGVRGKQSGPQDGTGKQQGKGPKGKQTGPKDGTGPIHTPPKQ